MVGPWCVDEKLFHYYESYRNGRTPDRSQGKPYADYIQWLGKQNKQEAEDYWKERLDGAVQHQGLLQQKKRTDNMIIGNGRLHGTLKPYKPFKMRQDNAK